MEGLAALDALALGGGQFVWDAHAVNSGEPNALCTSETQLVAPVRAKISRL
jgi:hypothetical protein